MTLGGASKKQLQILGGLGVVLVVVFYFEFFSGPSEPQYTAAPAASAPAASAAPTPVHRQLKTDTRRAVGRIAPGDWKPRLGAKNPDDRPDPATVDPTLHLTLLAKVQEVAPPPPGRNLFVFGAAPPPPAAKIDLPKVAKIPVNQPSPPPPMMPAGPPPPPQAPPMAFKYYGYKVSKSDGHKAAFLLDGDDILIAGENDTFKHRYRVVRILQTSIVIEDTQFKSTQTLPIQETGAV